MIYIASLTSLLTRYHVSREKRILQLLITNTIYPLIKKINFVRLPLFIFVILIPLIISNYNDGSDTRNDAVLNQAFAQTGKIDSSPKVGMNMRGYYTTMSEEREVTFNFPSNYYEDSFRIFSDAGIEFVRYVFFWESYEKDPFSFMIELETLSQTADKWGINVIYANDQFHISSWLDPEYGYGFSSFLFKNNNELL
jgi:hypothetical protein